MAPSDVPDMIIETLNAEINEVVADTSHSAALKIRGIQKVCKNLGN